MQDLCHQHICKLYQVIETTDRFYMVLEVRFFNHAFALYEKVGTFECFLVLTQKYIYIYIIFVLMLLIAIVLIVFTTSSF
jgi:hypothetical protein